MMIFAAGVNHRTAPVDLRECLHVGPEELRAALAGLVPARFREAAIVSTCNRTELYALAEDGAGGEALIEALRGLRRDVRLEDGHFFRLFSCGAVTHLYRVAAAIDSQVLGDMQILGQVKDAYEAAVGGGAVGQVLGRMFSGALHTGKRVRRETAIGIGAVSISFAAVELARKIFADLHRKRVLVIGTGETGALAARHLREKGVERILLANRTRENALPLAAEIGAEVVEFDSFPARVHEVDIVVSATASPEPVLTAPMVREAMRRRSGRPLLLLDLAMPRDIDPAANELPSVFLKDLDAIQSVVDQNLEARRREIPRAEVIITEEVVNFFVWYNTLETAPIISRLRQKYEQVRVAEIEKFRNRIDPVSLEAVDMLTKRIVNKLLHPAMVGIRRPSSDSVELRTRLRVVHDLFDLPRDQGADETAGDGR